MKTVMTICLATVLLLAAAGGAADTEEKPWFDMVNCGFCKHLMDDPELLNHCTWEHHNVANGMVSVTTVEKDYLPSYRAAMARMEEVGKKMEQGEMVPMCGMCTAMGGLMMKGVKWENVPTQHGDVTVFTSDDPAMVAEIHAFTDKTNKELAKMEAKGMEEDEEE